MATKRTGEGFIARSAPREPEPPTPEPKPEPRREPPSDEDRARLREIFEKLDRKYPSVRNRSSIVDRTLGRQTATRAEEEDHEARRAKAREIVRGLE